MDFEDFDPATTLFVTVKTPIYEDSFRVAIPVTNPGEVGQQDLVIQALEGALAAAETYTHPKEGVR